MKPRNLVLCAWGPYSEKQEVDFTALEQKGIFLITGATGAGKTTIFDAITYALYGALSGDEHDKERGSVRSDFAAPHTPTYVELAMEHGGRVYHIRRNPEYMRPKKRRGSAAGAWESGTGSKNAQAAKAAGLTREFAKEEFTREKENAILTYPDGRVLEGVREVNAALQEILVLDYQQFKKISMIAQGEFARLLVAPPKEKTRIFREIFGTGTYDRFTQALGMRSRELYGRVMEQKHKLEEDIRLLTVGLEGSAWREETRHRLSGAVQAQDWNYQELSDILQLMEEEAGNALKEQKNIYKTSDKRSSELTEALARQEALNKKIQQFQEAGEKLAALQKEAAAYQGRQQRLKQAVNAGWVEAAEEKKRSAAKQLADAAKEKEHHARERGAAEEEIKALEPLLAQAENVRDLLELARMGRELHGQKEEAERLLAARKDEFSRGQKDYLKKEQACREAKQAYEEADRRRKMAAIGLAAALLEEGKPCPVCGSLSHPAPAPACQEVASEEELAHLKELYEQKAEKLQRRHENLVAIRTQTESLEEQAAQLSGKIEENSHMQAQLSGKIEESSREQPQLSGTTGSMAGEYLDMEPEEALKELNARCERANALKGLLAEKVRSWERLGQQEESLKKELSGAEADFCRMLSQYGFADEEAYQQAKMPRQDREALEQEIDAYNRQVAANEELYRHLEQEAGGQESQPLEELERRLAEQNAVKQVALKGQRIWEGHLSEVKKARKMMRDKLDGMEQDRTEYGYVKDLENMASGNNRKKLVFEQYVLAGYFEEILRAANLRFQKMTSGRYEMYRVGEAGDGRIKDSLEIQVMDYYTGKYRSVRTLSGGESFKASLSLALGMSDVIQAMSGGIRVDALFVDEGFGALDEESLNQACDTLMGLVEKNKMIGIISHVPELRERMEQQLVIERTSTGSRICG